MKKILLLMSDTGGGHRACAQALQEALTKLYPTTVAVTIVDGLKDHSPVPFKYAAPLYPWLTKSKRLWGNGFTTTNSPHKIQILTNTLWPYLRPKILSLLRSHPADLIISLHPLLAHSIIKGLTELKLATPFVIVVTDPVTPHAAWFPPGATHYFVSTDDARRIALGFSLPASSISTIGHPISLAFKPSTPISHRPPSLLVMGGGQGQGNLYRAAIALDQVPHAFCLTIIAGRNPALHRKLSSFTWSHPTHILGFTTDVPTLMHTTDIFVTKAGPSSLYEALACHLPTIIYDYLPGQEDGNLQLGTYCPTPTQLTTTVSTWLSRPNLFKAMRRKSARLARPRAALDLAKYLYKLL